MDRVVWIHAFEPTKDVNSFLRDFLRDKVPLDVTEQINCQQVTLFVGDETHSSGVEATWTFLFVVKDFHLMPLLRYHVYTDQVAETVPLLIDAT